MYSFICAEDLAYKEIKERILEGRLQPGQRLVHRTIARDLGVSSVPIVLALRMLERDGLVVNIPGRGAYVRRWTVDDIIGLYRIRAFQESLAANLCAVRATSIDLEAIQAAEDAFKQSLDNDDPEANIRGDIEFHTAVIRGAHCPDLERMVESLSILRCSMRAFCLSLNIPRFLSPAFKGAHEPIVRAILNRNPKAAEQAARKHVEESLDRNLAWVEEVSASLVNGRTPQSPWRLHKPAPADEP